MTKKTYTILIELDAKTFLTLTREVERKGTKYAKVIAEIVEAHLEAKAEPAQEEAKP